MISSLFVIPWTGTEPLGLPRKDQRPTLLVRDYVGDAGNALVRIAFEQFNRSPPGYNPTVLYGPPGTGKTHLSWLFAAVAGGSAKHNSTYWATGADFVRQVSHAIEADSIADFRHRLRTAPAVLIDGLERIAGRAAAQSELLVALDDCLARDVPFVVTSTSLPLELADLTPPLASRLQNGLVVPLTPPGPAARQHLLCELAAKHRVVLPPELPRRLTERLRKAADFRPTALELNELIGALAQLDADGGTSSYLARADEFAERWVARPAVSLRTVSQAVAQYFGIKPMELKGPSRRQMVVRARGVAIYLGRHLAGESLDRLGEHFGGRDHSTALHAVRKTEELLGEDPTLRKAVDDLTQKLQLESDR